ncbi:MAG TPA: ribosomal RNA small subunit methyltransferase A [Euryarchaeota archaeon]|nr:ribosomal RNA small subunit methyltransferase A [Euryarchaeota archaeon]
MDLNETKSLLRRHGISPNKIQGQNFLVDPAVAKREVEAAELTKSDVVLEVGPGLGALTEHILSTGCKVVAVERDPSFIKILKSRFPTDRLELICADVMKIDLPDFNVVVSNIPYVISSPLTFKLLEHGFECGVLTFQMEFAERLVAEPGEWEYSRLSVGAGYYADIEILEELHPRLFYPPPRVRSAVVKIVPRPPKIDVDKTVFFKLVRGMFTVKKKTVKNGVTIAKKIEGIDVDLADIPVEILKKRVFELWPEEIALISNKARLI